MNCLPWHKQDFGRLLAMRVRLPHALLIHGRQGIGKLVFAQALVQSLLCEAPTAAGAACGKCAACSWCEAGGHPDWLRIEPDQSGDEDQGIEKKFGRQITVDQIRQLPDFINISSHRCGRKFVLVHPAEALNVNAANALLKSLEEPPPNTYFILVAHRPHFLLPTIKSRCQHVALAPPSAEVAEAWLRAHNVGEPALALAQAGNAPLLAAHLADGDWWQQRATLLCAIASPRFDPLAVAEQVRDVPLPHLVGWLQKWSFDLIFKKFLGKIRYNPDYADAVADSADSADTWSLLQFHRDLLGMQRVVNHPLNARLVIEDLLLVYARLLRGSDNPSR